MLVLVIDQDSIIDYWIKFCYNSSFTDFPQDSDMDGDYLLTKRRKTVLPADTVTLYHKLYILVQRTFSKITQKALMASKIYSAEWLIQTAYCTFYSQRTSYCDLQKLLWPKRFTRFFVSDLVWSVATCSLHVRRSVIEPCRWAHWTIFTLASSL